MSDELASHLSPIHKPLFMRQKSFLVLAFIACLLEASFLVLLRLYNWNQEIPTFLAVFFLSFAVYLFGVRLILKEDVNSIPHLSLFIFLTAVLFRITVFWCEPTLSEDFYRYVWDGRVQEAGLDPYDYPPQAPELAFLRDSNYSLMKHREIRTAYPPAAQNIFLLFTNISSNPLIFKFGILGFDFLLLEVLRRLLKQKGLTSFLLLYAWHPLPIVEFAGSAHVDIIALSLMLSAYLLLQNSRKSIAGFVLATAIQIKYLPAVAIPWMVRKGGWKFLVVLTVMIFIFIFQFYTPDLRMLSGIRIYYQKWWFNDSLFSILYNLLGGAEPARRCGQLFVAASIVYCLVAKYSFYRSFFVIYGTMLLFSPVVHPWYVCWMIPFLIFHRNLPWLFFSGWVAMAYLIRYLTPVGQWERLVWLKLLVYMPFYALLIAVAIRDYRSKKNQPIPNSPKQEKGSMIAAPSPDN